MAMQRWEPFADLRKLENRMARMFNRFPTLFGEDAEEWTVPLDVREQDGNLIVEASIPGMKSDDITVEIEGEETPALACEWLSMVFTA